MVHLPRTISDQALAYLERRMSRPALVWPDPADYVAWKPFVERLDADMAAFYRDVNLDFRGLVVHHELAACRVFEVLPAGVTVAQACALPAVLYVHGGAFVMGGGLLAAEAAKAWAADLAGMATVYSVDYRLPPDHVYPAALDDVVAALEWMKHRHVGLPTAAVGVSAGGGLLASALIKARDLGKPRPQAVVLMMPECDLAETGDSFEVLREADVVLRGSLMNASCLYSAGADLAHPYLSALYGDPRDAFPPVLLVGGTRDLFLSNTVRMHRWLRRAGMEAELSVFEAMPHGGFPGSPENDEMHREQVLFLMRHLRAQSAA